VRFAALSLARMSDTCTLAYCARLTRAARFLSNAGRDERRPSKLPAVRGVVGVRVVRARRGGGYLRMR